MRSRNSHSQFAMWRKLINVEWTKKYQSLPNFVHIYDDILDLRSIFYQTIGKILIFVAIFI